MLRSQLKTQYILTSSLLYDLVWSLSWRDNVLKVITLSNSLYSRKPIKKDEYIIKKKIIPLLNHLETDFFSSIILTTRLLPSLQNIEDFFMYTRREQNLQCIYCFHYLCTSSILSTSVKLT